MLHAGLVSVTFRKLTPAEVVKLVVQARLTHIEWGGDIHVPHGDLTTAKEVRRMTLDAGLQIAAYGSYYRLGRSAVEGLPFERVLETAVTLGAPVIRVWAGDSGSTEADAAYRRSIADETAVIAEAAAQAGTFVAYEYHEGTLTDTPESAVALLREVGHPCLKTLWQPIGPDSCDARLESLRQVLPWLAHVHAYCWRGHERRTLAEGAKEWSRYLQLLSSLARDCPVLLEFVRRDAPEAFREDAQVLAAWLRRQAGLGAGHGNYTEERDAIFGQMSVDDIVTEIRRTSER